MDKKYFMISAIL